MTAWPLSLQARNLRREFEESRDVPMDLNSWHMEVSSLLLDGTLEQTLSTSMPSTLLSAARWKFVLAFLWQGGYVVPVDAERVPWTAQARAPGVP